MAFSIRQATEDDTLALSHVCLLTADAGSSAESLHELGELPGLVYAVPYVKLPNTWGFVLEKQTSVGSSEVVGYIVGSTDTRAYEKYAEETWWPSLAKKYHPDLRPLKPADERYIEMLRNQTPASDVNIAFSTAHMHINILEQYQRQGWGKKLIAEAIEYLKGKGLKGVWLGVDPRNEGARQFYEKIGFREIEGGPDPNQLGLVFDHWK